jgi:transposase
VSDVQEDELYAALDWLRDQQSRIERKLVKRHLTDGSLVLYDLTSAAYTGNHCPLAEFGFPPQGGGRHRYRQIRFGLVCSRDGIPVAVEVFKGNAVDSATLGSQVEKLRKRYGVRRVVMVGDRGVLTEACLREDLAPEGLGWITALRAPAIRTLLEAGTIQMSLFDQKDLAEITSPDYPGERLITCRNPFLIEERAQKRDELLRATEKELDKIVAATWRVRRPLRGEAQIGLRVGAVVNKHRMAKHFQVHITDKEFCYERDTESIAAEAALDGIYIIRTSVPAEEMAAEETVRAYKGLAVVERAFRSLKSVDLKVSPIYHRLDIRVEAHVFLCMLAYYVEWHMRQALAPILFDDDDQETARARRRSVVAPAERSPQAQRKAQTKRTAQGRTGA